MLPRRRTAARRRGRAAAAVEVPASCSGRASEAMTSSSKLRLSADNDARVGAMGGSSGSEARHGSGGSEAVPPPHRHFTRTTDRGGQQFCVDDVTTPRTFAV
eukprot:TRINITY_DN15787_c0_g1_i1.p3 TRINITY_DN15787_c0_g1~~TRINITY_DN15787_c0_g1_i1.p3  ORF type:complete len:102 (-),score=16.48 TRINITY_DN15787_c0_g1_i1:532-837(-)